MSWLMTGGAAASGIISGISGLSQKAKARKLEASNKRPTNAVPNEILENNAKAKQLSDTGIQGNEYNKATQGIDRAANAAIGQTADRRGGLATIGAIQQNKQDAMGSLTVQDTQQRFANIRNQMQQNQVLAGYRDKEFGYNQDAKYQENASAIRALKGAGNDSLNSAANSFLSAGATAFAGGGFKKKAPSQGLTNDEGFAGAMSSKQGLDKSLIPQSTPTPLANINNMVSGDSKRRQALQDPTMDENFYGNDMNSLNFWKKSIQGN